MYEIEAIPAFNDNYIWLIKNNETQHCVVIDPGDAKPVINWLANNPQWQLSHILITHHHQDHTGGISELKQQTNAIVYAPNNPNIANVDQVLTDKQTINILGLTAHIMAVPGHTLDHIVYYFPKQQIEIGGWLFSGDTLFAGGCGRVFEGTMQQMYQSLQRLNELPAETLIYAAHEYTVSNLKFAHAVEQNNSDITQQLEYCESLRIKKLNTLPSTLAIERYSNPFLRCDQPSVIQEASQRSQKNLGSPLEVFSVIREWKNNF